MQMTRVNALLLKRAGRAAYKVGDPSDASPYDRFGNAEQQYAHQYWTRGWMEARTAAEAAQDQAGAAAR